MKRIDTVACLRYIGYKLAERMEKAQHYQRAEHIESTCPIAVLLAARLPLSDASTGVMVVPMLPPRIIAHPRAKEIHPCEHMISVMANGCGTLRYHGHDNAYRENISTEPTPRLV